MHSRGPRSRDCRARGRGRWQTEAEGAPARQLDCVQGCLRARSAPVQLALSLHSSLSLQAQRAELEALLLQQEAAAAERQRQRLEREGELLRVQLELAMHHMAACAHPAAAALLTRIRYVRQVSVRCTQLSVAVLLP